MSALPQQPLMMPGFSPWQAPLAALFSGLAAAGQPGGLSNFGIGAQQGAQNFQQGQQQQQIMQLRQQQIEQAQEEQRRANQEEAQRQAKLDLIKQTLTGSPGSSGQSAILGGMTPQQSQLFSTYAQVDPENAFQMLAQQTFAQPKTPSAPTIQNFYEGSNVVQKQWDPNTQTWVKVGEGQRFAPTQGGGGLSIAAPVWGVDEGGNSVIMQLSPSGTAVQTQLPKGVKPVRPNVQVDTGTGTAMVSPVTGQATNVIPKDVAGQKQAQAVGEGVGKAQVDLPTVEQNADYLLGVVDQAINSPGREAATGASSVFNALAIPGSNRANFLALRDQIKGAAFLQSYNVLRGGGQITEVEGEKATNALIRMQTTQSETEFKKSLEEFQTEIKKLVQIARNKASGNLKPLPNENIDQSEPKTVDELTGPGWE